MCAGLLPRRSLPLSFEFFSTQNSHQKTKKLASMCHRRRCTHHTLTAGCMWQDTYDRCPPPPASPSAAATPRRISLSPFLKVFEFKTPKKTKKATMCHRGDTHIPQKYAIVASLHHIPFPGCHATPRLCGAAQRPGLNMCSCTSLPLSV